MSSIQLNNVCLDYIVKTGTDSIKRTALHLCNALLSRQSDKTKSINNSTFRALNNIHLDIRRGDRVGLLGRNGAGKSTLLRVIAKIYRPNFGTIAVNGSVSSLFDVNLGLNPEASGYENIVTLGIMRGMSKKKAQSLIPDVASFTELGNFLTRPVRTYSTGMQMKLAFAVATAQCPEIVLIDEIIGVGDAHFMTKANKRISNMVENSHILVLTSHANDIIRRFCNKVVVLDGGEVQYFGDVETGIDLYQSKLAN